MELPPLLKLTSESEYRQRFTDYYCSGSPIFTYDGIPVAFYSDKFGHSFYKRSYPAWNAPKTKFDISRCERMLWIEYVLKDPAIHPHMGYDKATGNYDNNRRVALLTAEKYVVVISRDNIGKWRFVTAYPIDDDKTVEKIKNSPLWISTGLKVDIK